MNIKFKPGAPDGSLDGFTLDCSASYEPTGIRLTWKAASEKVEQNFVYRVLDRHNRDSAGQPPASGELTASGELFIPDFLLSYQIHIECFDEADTSERLAVIIIEDIGDF